MYCNKGGAHKLSNISNFQLKNITGKLITGTGNSPNKWTASSLSGSCMIRFIELCSSIRRSDQVFRGNLKLNQWKICRSPYPTWTAERHVRLGRNEKISGKIKHRNPYFPCVSVISHPHSARHNIAHQQEKSIYLFSFITYHNHTTKKKLK